MEKESTVTAEKITQKSFATPARAKWLRNVTFTDGTRCHSYHTTKHDALSGENKIGGNHYDR